MKHIQISLISFIFLLSTFYLSAQVPQKFNYQGIARDTKGNPMAHQRMTLKLTVLPTADATTGEYEEIQTVTTNEFGLYTLQIGNGTPVIGEMKTVKWETGNKYIKVAIDPKGSNDFVDAGTNQLLSVPYAIYADKAGMAKTSGGDRTGAVNSAAGHVVGDANYLTKFTGLNVIAKSQLFDNGTNVGLGTATPISTASMHVKRSTSGQYLYLENTLPTGFGSFRLYNDVPANFATFTKYGSTAVGGYTGISTLYPFANILGYGNNGPFLNAGTGNIGFAITKAGTNKLKIHIDYTTENVGIGGNTPPLSRVHMNNTDGTTMDLRLTNNTTGHTVTDGLEIRTVGNAAAVMNNENADLNLGTNGTNRIKIEADGKVGVGSTSPNAGLQVLSSVSDTAIYASSSNFSHNQIGVLGTYNTSGYGVGIAGIGFAGGVAPDSMDIGVYGSSAIGVWSNGKLRVTDGTQGAGKIMQSNADGDASWVTPSFVNGNGTTNFVPKYTPNGTTIGNSQIFDNGTSVGIGTATPNASTRLHLTKNSEVLRLDGSAPYLSFYNGADYNGYLWHNNTDMYLANRSSGGGLRLYTENIARMMIDSNGYVGIGTTAPSSRLDLRSNNGDYLLANFRNTSTTNDRSALIGMQSGNATGATHWLMGVGGTANGLGFTGNQFYLENAGKGSRMSIDSFGAFKFGAAGSTQNGSTLNLGGKDNQPEASISFGTNGEFFNMAVNVSGQLQITPNNNIPTGGTPCMTIDDESGGRVAIGTVASMPTGYKLFVEDGILTERLKVAVNGSGNWADYVFADNYKLMPLEDVEAFVKDNKHLPNVPSADEMVESGIDVATVDAKLMEKIEELTLYMIDMKKEINTLKKENEAFKANLKK